MTVALRVLAVLAGTGVVAGTLLSAMRTVVVPRGVPVRLTGVVFSSLRWAFGAVARHARDEVAADQVMTLFAPVSLMVLPVMWMVLVMAGFTAVLWGAGVETVGEAFRVSGSALTTLGTRAPAEEGLYWLVFLEATLGVSILALLLVTYLPSMYAAFSRRERMVSMLDVRAGTPPRGVAMLVRYARIRGLEKLADEWPEWERWFAEVNESHTSLPAVAHFRSPERERSWVTAAGALLDAASLFVSVVDLDVVNPDDDRDPMAEICIRSGYITLRNIADFFGLPYRPDPAPDDPISVTRDEFDRAVAEMRDAGVPLRRDLDAAWTAFAGWRVNYDDALLGLAALTMAPTAPWTSDRSPVIRDSHPMPRYVRADMRRS